MKPIHIDKITIGTVNIGAGRSSAKVKALTGRTAPSWMTWRRNQTGSG